MSKRQSEYMKESLAHHRGQIAQHERRIAQLASRNMGTRDAAAAGLEVQSLRQAIQQSQNTIRAIEARLPMVEQLEQATDRMNQQAAREQAEREQADTQAHAEAVRQAALVEWLQVPGQTQAGFDVAWPGIAQRIAHDRAVEAAHNAHEQPHAADQTRQIALDFLGVRYKMPKGKGHQVGGIVQPR